MFGNIEACLKYQVAKKEPQVERRIAKVAGFKIDQQQPVRPDQHVLGAEIRVHQAAGVSLQRGNQGCQGNSRLGVVGH
jgi:hypothetical protein